MRRLITRLRSAFGLRRTTELDRAMSDEMRFHIDMEAERLMRGGLDPQEARRRAAVNFGGIEKYRGAGRDALGFTPARGLSVDVKLGLRMLARSPGLTVVALFALTLAIGAGVAYLEFTRDLMHGRLPFPDGDRVVGIQNWDQQTGDPENRSAFEFVHWRQSLTTIDTIGAYRPLGRSLITEDGRAEPVRGVAISASGFRLAGVPPLYGRPLSPDDEKPGAAPVVVLGHDVFSVRFASDPAIIGRTIKLGADPYTVVGVMPQGFGFPVNHALWVPLSLNETGHERRTGTEIKIFGRLADGATIEQAQAELTASAVRLAQEFPDTHRHLRPSVKLYIASMWSGVQDSAMQTFVLYAANLFFIGLLALCGANVATLVFARTATRDGEISLRTALGASRGRIIGQLFVEALVLTTTATVFGLAFAYYGLKWVKVQVALGQQAPVWFWWNDRLTPESMIYALLLAVLAALIVGVIPALKATGPRVQERLKHTTGGSAAGLRFGGVWTGVIVLQVSITVVFLAVVTTLFWGLIFQNAGERALTIPADRYVVARLNTDRDIAPEASNAEADAQYRRRLRTFADRFAERLAAEPGVLGSGFGSRLPGMNHIETAIEVDGGDALPGDRGVFVRSAAISPGLLPALQARLVEGRAFTEADAAPGRHVAIVDQTFVRTVLGGGPAVGRQFRSTVRTQVEASGRGYVHTPESADARGPWTEIVGVIEDLTDSRFKQTNDAVFYQPAYADVTLPLYTAVHVAGETGAMMWRLRVIAAEIDPALRLDEMMRMDQLRAADRVALSFFLRLLTGIGVVALVLATAGVYALMSFTVARRTTEIGIRLALGADSRRIVFTTFARALAQVSAGVAIGVVPAAAIAAGLGPELAVSSSPATAVWICAVAAGGTILVTALACVGPARRVLRIQPIDTLKAT